MRDASAEDGRRVPRRFYSVSESAIENFASSNAACKTPKTKSSYRTVSFPQFLAARLKALQRSELAQRFRFGQDWQGEDWIFVQDNGKMMSYSTPYEAFQDAIRRYNDEKAAEDQLPLIPFHGLRHTSATLMIASRQDEKNRVKQTRPRANLDHDEHLCPRLAGKRPQSNGHYRKSTLKRGMSAKKSRSSSQIVAKWLFGTGSRFKAKRKSLDFQGFFMELLGGFEPPTSSLPRMRSTY